MASAGPSNDGFIKCLKAIHFVCSKVVQCFAYVIQDWHTKAKASLGMCTTPQQCHTSVKPKSPKSCQACLKWGKALEAVEYTDPLHNVSSSIAWSNVNCTQLFHNPVEVSKAFSIRFPKGQQHPTKLDEFDTASIILMMMKFGEFHRYDYRNYEIIQKISHLRNSLSHMGLSDNMHINDAALNAHFKDMSDFVDCLHSLHPGHFSAASVSDIKTQLNDILTTDSDLKPLTASELASILDTSLKEIEESITEKVEKGIASMEIRMKTAKDDVNNVELRNKENIKKWRGKLADRYLRERNEVRFGRGSLDTAFLDDLFVDLILIEEERISRRKNMQVLEGSKEEPDNSSKYIKVKGIQGADISTRNTSNRRKLNSYLDLFQMKIKDQQANLLLFGAAGTGKTTQINKIALKWAENVKKESRCDSSQTLLDTMELVLVLDVNRFLNSQNIVHALAEEAQRQLLPLAEILDIDRVFDYLGKKCLVIFDGFDELPINVEKHALDCPHVQSLFAITTTRPHVKDIFCRKHKGYIQIQVSGFSVENIARYITCFFEISGMKDLAPSLIEKMETNLLLQSMSSFPILLVMICLIWERNNGRDIVFQSMTSLYKEVMTKQCFNKLFEEREQLSDKEVENVILSIGKPSLEALLEKSIVMQEREFDKTVLEKAICLGLMVRDEGSLPGEKFIRFIHKTLQEYCAAVYLCSLFVFGSENILQRLCCVRKSSMIKESFQSYISRINAELVEKIEYVLRFCCGLSFQVAVAIFKQVLSTCQTSENPWRVPLILLYEIEVTHESSLFQKYNFYRDLESLYATTTINASDADMLAAMRHLTSDKHNSRKTCFKSVTIFESQYEKAEQEHIVQILNTMPSLETASVNMNTLYSEQKSVVTSLAKLSSLYLSVFEPVDTKSVATFLQSMPALETIELNAVEIVDDIHHKNTNIPLHRCIKETVICNCKGHTMVKVSVKTLVQLVNRMPALSRLALLNPNLTDETGELHDTHVTLSESLTEFVLAGAFPDREYNVNISQLVRFLGCMPAVTKMSLYEIQLIGELEDTNVSLSKSLKECVLFGILPDREYNVNISQLVRFLGCMPALTKVILQDTQLIGILEDTHVTLSESLTEFVLVGKLSDREYNVNISQLVRFLGCMPALTKVILQDAQVIGILEDTHVSLSESLKEFVLVGKLSDREYNVNISQLVRFLGCMPALTKVILQNAQVIGILEDTHVTLSESLTVFVLGGTLPDREYNVNISQLVRFLGCMPALTKVSLWDTHLIGILEDTHVTLSESLKEFVLGGRLPDREYNVNISQLVSFLGCMPAITKVKLQDTQVIGILEDTHVTLSESLKECVLVGDLPDREYNVNISQLVNFLGCMPALTKVILQDTQLIGILEDTHVTLSESLKECVLVCNIPDREYYVNVNISQLVSFLGCMPGLETVSLNDTHLTGEFADTHVTLSESLKEFVLVGDLPDREINLNISQLVRFLGCMPALTKVSLCDTHLTGEFEDTNATLRESLKEFRLTGRSPDKKYKMDATRLVKFLTCMPGLSKVIIQDVELTGKLDNRSVPLSETVEEFTIQSGIPDTEYTVNISQLVGFLVCMPTLTRVIVQDTHLTGDLNANCVDVIQSVHELWLVNYLADREFNVNVSQLIRFMQRLPALTTVVLGSISDSDGFDGSHSTLREFLQKVSKFVHRLPNGEHSISVSKLLHFISRILPDVVRQDARWNRELDECHVTLVETLKHCVLIDEQDTDIKQCIIIDFSDKGTFYRISASTFGRLLQCIPGLPKYNLLG